LRSSRFTLSSRTLRWHKPGKASCSRAQCGLVRVRNLRGQHRYQDVCSRRRLRRINRALSCKLALVTPGYDIKAVSAGPWAQRCDSVMRCPAAGFSARWSWWLAFLQVRSHNSQPIPRTILRLNFRIEIKLPRWVNSESVFIRYQFAGEQFGGWVQPHPGVSSYFISTTHEGRPVTRIKAILYARGCAIQTLDLPVLGSNNQQYSFICLPLPTVWIVGALTRTDRLYGREVKLQAKYIARWSQSFLEASNAIVTTIPVGDVAYPSPDGRFRLSVPDFSQDPLAGAPNHPGELQIWATDQASDGIVALLIPAGPQAIKTRMGGLKIRSEYPPEIVFVPCAANPPRVHDAIGFAKRPGPSDACDR
jgi:hypothetical protein